MLRWDALRSGGPARSPGKDDSPAQQGRRAVAAPSEMRLGLEINGGAPESMNPKFEASTERRSAAPRFPRCADERPGAEHGRRKMFA